MAAKYFAVLAFTVFLVTPFIYAKAAVVKLKSGEELSGVILKKDKDTIELRAGGETRIYKLENIESIRGNKPRGNSNSSVKADNSTFENALSHAADGNFSKAKEILEMVLKNEPDDVNAKELLSVIKDVEMGKIDREYAEYLFKGAYDMTNQRYGQAIASFTKALEIDKRPEIYYDLGCAYQAMEKHKEAVFYLKRAIEKEPNDIDANYRLGLAFYTLKQYNEAIPYFEKVISLIPGDAETHAFIGMSYYLGGKEDKAREYIEKAKDLFAKEGNSEDAGEMDNLLKQW